MSSAKQGREFDTKAAIRAWDSELGSGDSLLFIEGARWQHQQDMKALDAALAEVEQLKLALADRSEKYKIAMDKGVDVLGYKLKTANALLEKAFRAGGDLLNNYLKCPQNPHNDPVVEWKYINSLREVIKEIEASRRGAG